MWSANVIFIIVGISTYEVPSIKNANLSIRYEWIKLQKFQIARKKGINVVVGFQYTDKFFSSSIFRNCPKKGAKGDTINIVNALQVFFKGMKQKRPLEKIFKI